MSTRSGNASAAAGAGRASQSNHMPSQPQGDTPHIAPASAASATSVQRARTSEEAESARARWEQRQAQRNLRAALTEQSRAHQELLDAQHTVDQAMPQARVVVRQEALNDALAQHPTEAAHIADLHQQRTEAHTAYEEALTEGRALNSRVSAMRDQLRAQNIDPNSVREYTRASRELSQAQLRVGTLVSDEARISRQVDQAEQRLIGTNASDSHVRTHSSMTAHMQQLSTATSADRAANQRYQAAYQRYLAAEQRANTAATALDVSRGGTGVRIEYGYGGPSQQAHAQALSSVFGRSLSAHEVAKLAGAQAGDSVRISNRSGGAVHVELSSPQGRNASLTVERRGSQIVISNTYVRNSGARTAASGREVVQTFKNYASLGVSKLEASAARSDRASSDRANNSVGYNGYYTWAKLGFTGRIPTSVLPAARQRFGNINTVPQLMQQPGGPEWWKTHGTTWNATFNFSPGSHSMRTLAKYDRSRS